MIPSVAERFSILWAGAEKAARWVQRSRYRLGSDALSDSYALATGTDWCVDEDRVKVLVKAKRPEARVKRARAGHGASGLDASDAKATEVEEEVHRCTSPWAHSFLGGRSGVWEHRPLLRRLAREGQASDGEEEGESLGVPRTLATLASGRGVAD